MVCDVVTATNENHTSSSSLPPQAFVCEDAVAPINVPGVTCVQKTLGLTGTEIAPGHSSFEIWVLKLFPKVQVLLSVALHIALI